MSLPGLSNSQVSFATVSTLPFSPSSDSISDSTSVCYRVVPSDSQELYSQLPSQQSLEVREQAVEVPDSSKEFWQGERNLYALNGPTPIVPDISTITQEVGSGALPSIDERLVPRSLSPIDKV